MLLLAAGINLFTPSVFNPSASGVVSGGGWCQSEMLRQAGGACPSSLGTAEYPMLWVRVYPRRQLPPDGLA